MEDAGLLIVDNSCYDELADTNKLARFESNLRAANWIARASEVNLLEAVASASEEKRAMLTETMHRVGGGPLLLKWPFAMLKDIGEAIAKGQDGLLVTPMDASIYFDDPNEAARMRDEVVDFNQKVEHAFNRLHEVNRVKLRRQMRQKGVVDEFGTARVFLEEAWPKMDTRAVFAEVTWSHFGLPGSPPMEILEKCEPWRILLDTEGVAIYERAIATNLPKRVQRKDLVQLVYMGLASRRMIVTGDNGLLRAANAIFPGRYRNARAARIQDLVA